LRELEDKLLIFTGMVPPGYNELSSITRPGSAVATDRQKN